MSMTTRGIIKSGENRDAVGLGPKGGAIIETVPYGQPSVADGATTQSPAGLIQPKGPTVVATFDGK